METEPGGKGCGFTGPPAGGDAGRPQLSDKEQEILRIAIPLTTLRANKAHLPDLPPSRSQSPPPLRFAALMP
jgi:hypothetical protein